MSDVDATVSGWRIRALNGPLRDACYDPSECLTIGRDTGCDIQVVHDGVSRQHAYVAPEAEGGHRLVDLGTANGTFVEGRRVQECMLQAGMAFEIMRYRFVYEPLVWVEGRGAGPRLGRPRLLGPDALRRTIQYSAFRGHDVDRVGAVDRSTMQQRPPGLRWGGVGSYEGDVVSDVADYRLLRNRILRGECGSKELQGAFKRLNLRLRAVEDEGPVGGERRMFTRFACRTAAILRLHTGAELSAELLDIGAEGAKVDAARHSIVPGTLVWLAVAREHSGWARTLVFPGRAAWVVRGTVAMSFSGAPGWSLRDLGSTTPTRYEPASQAHS